MTPLICALALLQVPTAVPVTLRWTPTVGEKSTYEISMTIDTGEKTTVDAVVEQSVVTVSADGTYQAVSRSLGALLRAGGQEVRDDRVVERTIEYGPRGDMRAITRGVADFQVYLQATYLRFIAPEQPVAVGGTWQYDRAASPGMSVPAAKVDYRLERITDGVATVTFQFQEAGDDRQAGQGTWTVNATTGQPISVEVTVKNFLGEKGASATIRMQRR